MNDVDGDHVTNAARATLVLGFAESAGRAQALATALGCAYAPVAVHHFPDGESRVTVPAVPPGHVVLHRSLDAPNAKLVELMLAARTLRELGATTLTLIAPYLCYMRQDVAFVPGEAVSQRIIGGFLADLFDTIVTVDPHLHRVASLAAAVPAQRALCLSAAPLLGEMIAGCVAHPLLLGPDRESAQWVAQVAAAHAIDFAVATKDRHGDRDVGVLLPVDAAVAGRDVVLVDDMVSTGHTLAEAARAALAAGAASVSAAVTHALYGADVATLLADAGITRVWSSDSVEHSSNAVFLAPLLAAALAPHLQPQRLHRGR